MQLLVLGCLFDLTDEVLTLAAALSVQSPLLRVDEDSPALQHRRELLSDEGDAFTVMNIYDEWIRVKADRFLCFPARSSVLTSQVGVLEEVVPSPRC